MIRAASSNDHDTAARRRVLRADGSPADLPPPFCAIAAEARACTLAASAHAHDGTASIKTIVTIRSASDRSWVLATAVHKNAAALDDGAFRAAAASTLGAAISALHAATAHPIARLWSFVPEIGRASIDGDRYRTFNAGRVDAFTALALAPLPAASGVGHAGDALIIHALALAGRLESVENPRQIPAWRYSPMYGAQPPLFARGTIVHLEHERVRACPLPIAPPAITPRAFFASGTASVVGEQSMHQASFDAQLQETLRNLDALCAAAQGTASELLRYLRIHLRPDSAHQATAVSAALHALLPEATLDFVIAPLCRPELALEIEGCTWEPHP